MGFINFLHLKMEVEEIIYLSSLVTRGLKPTDSRTQVLKTYGGRLEGYH
jgi:hypothetical protein